jgi:hypothetical protein
MAIEAMGRVDDTPGKMNGMLAYLAFAVELLLRVKVGLAVPSQPRPNYSDYWHTDTTMEAEFLFVISSIVHLPFCV